MSNFTENVMQFCHLSLQFIMTSKDNFEMHRSDQFLFQKVKITLIEQAVPHRGKPSSFLRNFLLLHTSWAVSCRPFRWISLIMFLWSQTQLFILWFLYNYRFITNMEKAFFTKLFINCMNTWNSILAPASSRKVKSSPAPSYCLHGNKNLISHKICPVSFGHPRSKG